MSRKHALICTASLLTILLLLFIFLAPDAFAAGGGAELGGKIGAIVGLIVGVVVLFYVHPVLAVIALIGGAIAIAKMYW